MIVTCSVRRSRRRSESKFSHFTDFKIKFPKEMNQEPLREKLNKLKTLRLIRYIKYCVSGAKKGERGEPGKSDIAFTIRHYITTEA